jgi:hypothetical protein
MTPMARRVIDAEETRFLLLARSREGAKARRRRRPTVTNQPDCSQAAADTEIFPGRARWPWSQDSKFKIQRIAKDQLRIARTHRGFL